MVSLAQTLVFLLLLFKKEEFENDLRLPNISLLSFMENQDHSTSNPFNGEFKL